MTNKISLLKLFLMTHQFLLHISTDCKFLLKIQKKTSTIKISGFFSAIHNSRFAFLFNHLNMRTVIISRPNSYFASLSHSPVKHSRKTLISCNSIDIHHIDTLYRLLLVEAAVGAFFACFLFFLLLLLFIIFLLLQSKSAENVRERVSENSENLLYPCDKSVQGFNS